MTTDPRPAAIARMRDALNTETPDDFQPFVSLSTTNTNRYVFDGVLCLDALYDAALPPAAAPSVEADDTGAPPRTVGSEAAAHVLWHYGHRLEGREPGSFTHALIGAAARADSSNLALIATAFPEIAAAVTLITGTTSGVEILTKIAAE